MFKMRTVDLSNDIEPDGCGQDGRDMERSRSHCSTSVKRDSDTISATHLQSPSGHERWACEARGGARGVRGGALLRFLEDGDEDQELPIDFLWTPEKIRFKIGHNNISRATDSGHNL